MLRPLIIEQGKKKTKSVRGPKLKLKDIVHYLETNESSKVPHINQYLNSAIYHEKNYNIRTIRENLPFKKEYFTTHSILINHLCHNCQYDEAIKRYLELARKLQISDRISIEKYIQDTSTNSSIAKTILRSLGKSRDVSNLLKLKLLWENYFFPNADSKDLEVEYFATFIRLTYNTHSYYKALELYYESFMSLTNNTNPDLNHDPLFVLRTFPTVNLLNHLIKVKNCHELIKLIKHIDKYPEFWGEQQLKYNTYHQILSMALVENNYELIQYLYDSFLMGNLTKQSFDDQEFDFLNYKVPETVSSLDSDVVVQILQTLSTHGDVSRTLELIEYYFIHKELKGDKALNIELCSKIIQAYCYNQSCSNWTDQSDSTKEKLQQQFNNSEVQDHSVEVVLDVLDNFIKKSKRSRNELKNLNYRDISHSMSYKFKTFNAFDENVVARKKDLIEKEENLTASINNVQDKDLPEDFTNKSLEISQWGNVLANLNTMKSFVNHHFKYLQTIKADTMTFTIFLNCLLNHINLYQNVTGLAHLLTNIHNINVNFVSEWLNRDSIDIILQAISKSNGAKQVSMEMFQFLRNNNYKLTAWTYGRLLNSIIRGEYSEMFQFYIYNYLVDSQGTMDPEIVQIINSLPYIDDDLKLKNLVKFLNTSPQKFEEYWDQHMLIKSNPQIQGTRIDSKRKYLADVDARDAKVFKHIFNDTYS